ncbi:phage late control D family protein [Salmonella enterica]|nr:phage late control D family protein [Salmonella enterica]
MASDNGGEVVKEIAARHNLKVALGQDLTNKALDHMDQTNESDASFLMKLARQYGAIASVKDGTCCLFGRDREERKRQAAAGYHHHAQSR